MTDDSTTVEIVLEGASAKIAQGTKLALSTLTHSGIVEHYITPVVRYFHLKYRQSAFPVQFGMCGCAVLALIPICSFAGMLFMASVGCLLVTGTALLAVEVKRSFLTLVLVPAICALFFTIVPPAMALRFMLKACSSGCSILWQQAMRLVTAMS
ncbi:hypothetical protein BGZ72_002850 [Mortierella alpina]|nr:hypothetical protein BGZ72_002850 [Mortierella alpina]